MPFSLPIVMDLAYNQGTCGDVSKCINFYDQVDKSRSHEVILCVEMVMRKPMMLEAFTECKG